jgi:hypothetical protein
MSKSTRIGPANTNGRRKVEWYSSEGPAYGWHEAGWLVVNDPEREPIEVWLEYCEEFKHEDH